MGQSAVRATERSAVMAPRFGRAKASPVAASPPEASSKQHAALEAELDQLKSQLQAMQAVEAAQAQAAEATRLAVVQQLNEERQRAEAALAELGDTRERLKAMQGEIATRVEQKAAEASGLRQSVALEREQVLKLQSALEAKKAETEELGSKACFT